MATVLCLLMAVTSPTLKKSNVIGNEKSVPGRRICVGASNPRAAIAVAGAFRRRAWWIWRMATAFPGRLRRMEAVACVLARTVPGPRNEKVGLGVRGSVNGHSKHTHTPQCHTHAGGRGRGTQTPNKDAHMGRKLTSRRALAMGGKRDELESKGAPLGHRCTAWWSMGRWGYDGTKRTRLARNGCTTTTLHSIAKYTEAARVGETAGATVAHRADDPRTDPRLFMNGRQPS